MKDNSLLGAERERIRITGLKAMELKEGAGQSLVRVETDAGICAIGEAGASGPVVRGHLRVLEPLLVGQNPLAIDRLYNTMMCQMHPWRSHVPTVSGVDIALWDLAGRILGLPICELLTGKYRDQVTIYYSPRSTRRRPQQDVVPRMGRSPLRAGRRTRCSNAAAPATDCPAIRARMCRRPRCPTCSPRARWTSSGGGHENIREALGFGVDIIFSEHGQFDLPASIGLCQALEPIKPLWMEDLLPIWCMESWKRLKDASRVPVMLGEKSESTRELNEDYMRAHLMDDEPYWNS